MGIGSFNRRRRGGEEIVPVTKPKPRARVSRDVALGGGTTRRRWGSGVWGQGAASPMCGGCECGWRWLGRRQAAAVAVAVAVSRAGVGDEEEYCRVREGAKRKMRERRVGLGRFYP
jgi:hypothetical protein